MKFFIDTANFDEIKEAHAWGIISGVTTNPSLVAKENISFHDRLSEITALVDWFCKCGSNCTRCRRYD